MNILSLRTLKASIGPKANVTVTAVAVLLSNALVSSYVLAEPSFNRSPVEMLLKSPEVASITARRRSGEESRVPVGVAPNGEFWSLFASSSAVEKISSWLGVPSDEYNVSDIGGARTNDMVYGTSRYTTKSGTIFDVTVLIPHPDQLLACDHGLVPEFAEISSFRFMPDSEDDIPLRTFKGILYTRLDGTCLYKIPLNRHAWYTVKQKGCKDPSSLVEFSGQLDLERLNQKLAY
jgi:hypothetical protein